MTTQVTKMTPWGAKMTPQVTKTTHRPNDQTTQPQWPGGMREAINPPPAPWGGVTACQIIIRLRLSSVSILFFFYGPVYLSPSYSPPLGPCAFRRAPKKSLQV